MKEYAVTTDARTPLLQIEQERLMTEAEAADFLRISHPTLKRFRYKGKIKFYKIGVLIRYSEFQLKDFLNSCSNN
jgi:excisionase family DNA binding protein